MCGPTGMGGCVTLLENGALWLSCKRSFIIIVNLMYEHVEVYSSTYVAICRYVGMYVLHSYI